jgi:hypothetical protein
MVGLFFFLRGSVKDRTEVITLLSLEDQDKILENLKQYFQTRAYEVVDLNGYENKVTFEGFVRPSLWLAILLTLLAGCGLFCLTLVLSFLFPEQANLFLWLALLSPLVGIFYWKKAGRVEQVYLKLDSQFNEQKQQKNIIKIMAHRDELIELQKSVSFNFSVES